MIERFRSLPLILLIAAGGITSGCAPSSRWDVGESPEAGERRSANVLTAAEIAEYPADYAVTRILLESFPAFWARNEAVGTGAPLVVLDGVPGSSYDHLRAWDVRRIEVQYDAASTAYYGFRGSGGIILISTNRVSAPGETEEEDGRETTGDR